MNSWQLFRGSAIFKIWVLFFRGIFIPATYRKKCTRYVCWKFSQTKPGYRTSCPCPSLLAGCPSHRCTSQQERLASHSFCPGRRGKHGLQWEASSFCCMKHYKAVIICYVDAHHPHQPMGINEITLIFMSKFAKAFVSTDWLQILSAPYKSLYRLSVRAPARYLMSSKIIPLMVPYSELLLLATIKTIAHQ